MTVASEVGAHYDSMIDYYELLFGAQLHFGYWPDPAEDGDFPGALLRLTDLVADRLIVPGGGRVLDIGCGTGGPAIHIARRTGAEVVGVTISERQARHATARAEAEGMAGQVSFHHADAMDLPFDPASFDAAYALESAMHMPSRAGLLEQAATVLRPGAPLVLTDLFRTGDATGADLVSAYAEATLLTVLPALDDYRGLAAEAGMDTVDLLDITANCRRGTFINLVRTGQEQHDTMVASLGAEAADLFATMCTGLAGADNLGYLLCTVRRTG